MKLHSDDILGLKYKIKKKIGAGSFGEIYLAKDQKTQQEVAIKTESRHAKYPQVIYEAKVLKLLQKTDAANLTITQAVEGIPQVHSYGTEGEFNYMVIDILGPSLEDLFNYCGRKFTLKTTMMLVTQLLDRFKYIHKKTFVHRDIKPDNFLMGLQDKSHVAYIVDYGLAKRYQDPKTRQHIPYRNDKSLTGTARYASIHAHLGEELARRDDLEALGFVMLYFYKGQLPWQNLPAFSKSDKYRRIKETKVATSLEDLCTGCPAEFLTYMKHCRNLAFEEKPNYDMLMDLLKGLCTKEGIDLKDKQFDWVNRDQKVSFSLLKNSKEEEQPQNDAKEEKEFQFGSFLEAQRMIRGDSLRFLDMDRGNNIINIAYNQDMRRREIEQLKQEFQELKARGFKRRPPPIGETIKKGGPSISQFKREKWNEYKKEGKVEEQPIVKNNDADDSEESEGRCCEEGVIGIDSKSFTANASKFQTSPNKKKNKVIIVDDEEEKEFGLNTSINNHASIGTINYNKRISQFGGIDSSFMLKNDASPDGSSLEKAKSGWHQRIIQEEEEDDKGGLDYQKKIAGTQFGLKMHDREQNEMEKLNLMNQHKKPNSSTKINHVQTTGVESAHCFIF